MSVGEIMESLPNEIILEILEYCDIRSVLKMLRTCKRFYALKKLLKDRKLDESVYCCDEEFSHVTYSFTGGSNKYIGKYRESFKQILLRENKLVCNKIKDFEHGELIRIIFTNDQETLTKKFYEKGVLESTWQYLNDKLHGKYLKFYSNGRLKEEYNYFEDKRVGESYSYNKYGTLTAYRVYEEDELRMRWFDPFSLWLLSTVPILFHLVKYLIVDFIK